MRDNPLRSFIEVEVRGCGTHPTEKWALGLEPAALWAPMIKHTLDEASKAPQPLKKSKRATSEHARAEALEGQNTELVANVADSAALIAQLRAQLEGALGENKALRETNTQLEESKASLETELEDAHAQLNEMAKTRPLRYSDINDGLLAKHVAHSLTFALLPQTCLF